MVDVVVEDNDEESEEAMQSHWKGNVGVDSPFDEAKGQRPSCKPLAIRFTVVTATLTHRRGFLLEELSKGIVCALTRSGLGEGWLPLPLAKLWESAIPNAGRPLAPYRRRQ